MKIRKRISAGLVALLMSGTMSLCVAAAELPFKDVAADAWYYTDVKLAYESGLINGRDIDLFEPDGTLTYAEAVKLAACMHRNATNGDPIKVVSGYDWYIPYVEYCKKANIIFMDYNWNANITRAEYMDIFSRALPKKELPQINDIAYGAIPDVSTGHRYAYSIYTLYRAGILQGRDENLTCYPGSFVERSEVAAILTRMTDKSKRIKLDSSVSEGSEGNTTGEQPLILPWENGGKHPKDYTAEDVGALTEEQRAIFLLCEPESPAYKEWLAIKDNPANEPETDETEPLPGEGGAETEPPIVDEPLTPDIPSGDEEFPWDAEGGKRPSEYTLEEYNQLTEAQRVVFKDSFDFPHEYEAWLVKVGLKEADGTEEEDLDEEIVVEILPWDVEGGKPHDAYTKSDYDQLTERQKELFLAFFLTPDARDAWMIRYGLMDPPPEDNPAPDDDEFSDDYIVETIPWEEDGAKAPEDYTWAEYQQLTPFQKEVFRDSFFIPGTFEQWWDNNAQ